MYAYQGLRTKHALLVLLHRDVGVAPNVLDGPKGRRSTVPQKAPLIPVPTISTPCFTQRAPEDPDGSSIL